MPGVHSYVSAKDVPGNNETGPVLFDEEVFATDEVCLAIWLAHCIVLMPESKC